MDTSISTPPSPGAEAPLSPEVGVPAAVPLAIPPPSGLHTPSRAERIKLYCEIAAFGFGALFLVLQTLAGQFNYGTEVSITYTRTAAQHPQEDLVAVTIHLKRAGIGRLQLEDVLLRTTQLDPPGGSPKEYRLPERLREHDTRDGSILETQNQRGTWLPPGDGTQLAYLVTASPGTTVLVDVTILGGRAPITSLARPQWRASCIVPPNTTSN